MSMNVSIVCSSVLWLCDATTIDGY